MALQLHTDADRGEGRAKYILTGEGAGSVFVIDDKTGNIHVTKSLDREEKEEYVLLAQAVDKVSLRPLEPPSQFIIKVQDINDNPPVFLHPPYRASVPEMSNVGEGGPEVFVLRHELNNGRDLEARDLCLHIADVPVIISHSMKVTVCP